MGVEGAGNRQPKKTQVNQPSIRRKVEKKENWFSIARSYGIDIHELMRLNGYTYQNGKVLKNGKEVKLTIGMLINVPDTSKAGRGNEPTPASKTPSVVAPPQAPPSKSVHTVVKGDNPSQIADDNQISLRQLAAANGWTVKVVDDSLQVYRSVTNPKTKKESLEKVSLNIGEEINIPKSVTAHVPKSIAERDKIISHSGMKPEFLNLIIDYEGKNGNPHTVAYKDTGTAWTLGWGFTKGVKKGDTITEPAANARLAKEYLQIKEDIRITLGDETFAKLSKPMLEGLIDLVFNKGFGAINISKFSKAINSGDIAGATKQLIFNKSIQENKEYAGLFKRSLARLVMVYNGSSETDKKKMEPVIDQHYADCIAKGLPEEEINKIWTPKETENVEESAPANEIETSDFVEPIDENYEEEIYELNIDDTKPSEETSLKEIITKIEDSDLNMQERGKKVLAYIDAYAEIYDLSPEAVKIFKAEATKEYQSWMWVNTDNMTAMAGILDAKSTVELHKAITTVLDESEDAQKFTALTIKSKIKTKEDAVLLVAQFGGAKDFVKAMKKVGGFDVLKHCLTLIAGENSVLFEEFNKAVEKESYSSVTNVIDNATADSPRAISRLLEKTLDDDDNLDAPYYQHLMKQVNSDNILEIMRSKDIISGICEAENDRATIKAEIKRLFDIIDKNYELDDSKRQEFLDLIDKEFRERSVNPTTWWIGTNDIKTSFNNLISGELKTKNLTSIITKELGFEIEAEKERLIKLNGKPHIEKFTPTASGALDGRTIVINAGHGGVNKNKNEFDPGAVNTKTGIDEWILCRYMAKQVIEELQAQGANVILTAGYLDSVSYKNFREDMLISLHADSHNGTLGPRILAHKKDDEDKLLAKKILNNFVNSENTESFVDLKRKEITFNLKFRTNDKDVDSIQAKIEDHRSLQILRKNDRASNNIPSVLHEFCNIQDANEVRNILTGTYGKDIVDSIVRGIIDYWSE